MIWLLIKNGIVQNRIEADKPLIDHFLKEKIFDECHLVDGASEPASCGWTYDNKTLTYSPPIDSPSPDQMKTILDKLDSMQAQINALKQIGGA